MLMGGRVNDKAERIKIATLLVEFGAKIDTRNKSGKQAIDLADDREIKEAVMKVADQA